MKIFLNLASFLCFIGCILLVGTTFIALLDEEGVVAFFALAGIPVLVAQIITFQFVREKLDPPDLKKFTNSNQPAARSDLKGTPWEHNPGHTKKG